MIFLALKIVGVLVLVALVAIVTIAVFFTDYSK